MALEGNVNGVVDVSGVTASNEIVIPDRDESVRYAAFQPHPPFRLDWYWPPLLFPTDPISLSLSNSRLADEKDATEDPPPPTPPALELNEHCLENDECNELPLVERFDAFRAIFSLNERGLRTASMADSFTQTRVPISLLDDDDMMVGY